MWNWAIQTKHLALQSAEITDGSQPSAATSRFTPPLQVKSVKLYRQRIYSSGLKFLLCVEPDGVQVCRTAEDAGSSLTKRAKTVSLVTLHLWSVQGWVSATQPEVILASTCRCHLNVSSRLCLFFCFFFTFDTRFDSSNDNKKPKQTEKYA